MIERTEASERAKVEAADWAVRLQGRSVDATTVEAFYAWRQHPQNADAFARLDTLWSDAEALGTDRDIALAVHDALARPNERFSWFTAYRRSWAGAAVAASLALAVFFGIGHDANPQVLRTSTGEQRLVRLSDGTRLRLNTDTDVRVAFSSSRRDLELRHGEAFFEVAHDPSRPLIVTSGGAQVMAIGTRFDVRRMAGGVRVVLAEGRVRVAGKGDGSLQSVVLQPGQSAWVDGIAAPRIRSVDVLAETSWTSGHLTFSNTPLREAIVEINRYGARPVILEARLDGDARVNGVFETGDTKAFVDAVTVVFPLKAVSEADGQTRLVAARRSS